MSAVNAVQLIMRNVALTTMLLSLNGSNSGSGNGEGCTNRSDSGVAPYSDVYRDNLERAREYVFFDIGTAHSKKMCSDPKYMPTREEAEMCEAGDSFETAVEYYQAHIHDRK